MDERDKQRIIARFDQRLAQHPNDDARALAVGADGRHAMALKCLVDVGIVSGTTVLDVGCGLGALHEHLLTNDIACTYSGYDINPQLIETAQRRHPDTAFEVRDILEEDFPEFDFVVSSSSFNLKLEHEDNYEFIERMLRTMYQHARRAVAVDLMTSYVDFKRPEAFYYEPERVFRIAKGITKRVTLRHDLPLFQFCAYLYPDFEGWAR
jgi:2-polyprenyl-3-methyl-5-hydroxy-6-metoxy-1,4-benzoquinol methylase